MPVPSLDPRTVFSARREARAAEVVRLGRVDARYGAARLAAFLAIVAAAVAAFAFGAAPRWLVLAPVAAYVALALGHDGALRRLARARRRVAFCDAALARLEDRWAGTGDGGDRYAGEGHPYAHDLDLFGRGSLFELLCTARTSAGADRLAAWLLAPAPASEARARQGAVRELAPRVDLREDLAVLGDDLRAEVDPDRLATWAERPRGLAPWLGLAGLALAAANLASLAGGATGRLRWWPFLALAAATWALLRLRRERVEGALSAVGRRASELRVLAGVIDRMGAERFDDARLAALQASFGPDAGGGAAGGAARAVRRLAAAAERVSWAENQAFAPVGFLLLWRLQGALAVERWRARHGPAVRAWLAAVAELEALAALAGHAFLHPADAWPELREAGPATAPSFRAELLAHPLLPERQAVRNDVQLGAGARLLLVSGSNMSGKSTLLRTVGANAVLAMAGAPVRARSLSLTPLQPGATLRIQDSLAAGRSRFYAEITRLREVMDLAALAGAGRGPPLLFLLDELLAGTNSRDRQVGAEAVLRALLARGAVGLATTHDLALTDAAAAIPEAVNAHFEDEVVAGEILFDYRLRPGVVQRSNALALMRAVGLPLDP